MLFSSMITMPALAKLARSSMQGFNRFTMGSLTLSDGVASSR